MGLNNYKLGDLIYEITRRNTDEKYGMEYVRGISNAKEIMNTKAAVKEDVIQKFYVIFPGEFIYNPRTTRMGEKVGLGYNYTNEPMLFTFNNLAFGIKEEAKDLLLPDYLYMFFRRSEFDRYARINSWGSATELFTFAEMCNINISLPSVQVQKKYVDIYLGLLGNIDSLSTGIEKMQLTCDAYMERLLKDISKKAISNYIEEYDERNSDDKYEEQDVRGISTQKEFIPTKANMNGVSLSNYKIVRPSCFAYVSDTSRRGDKMSLAYNNSERSYIVSSITTTFNVISEELVPEYLFMFLRRSEFDRYARYNSWGSARETISWEDFGRLEIPVPNPEIQRDIVNIFDAMTERKTILERLTELQKNICPLLIKGAIEEGSRA